VVKEKKEKEIKNKKNKKTKKKENIRWENGKQCVFVNFFHLILCKNIHYIAQNYNSILRTKFLLLCAKLSYNFVQNNLYFCAKFNDFFIFLFCN